MYKGETPLSLQCSGVFGRARSYCFRPSEKEGRNYLPPHQVCQLQFWILQTYQLLTQICIVLPFMKGCTDHSTCPQFANLPRNHSTAVLAKQLLPFFTGASQVYLAYVFGIMQVKVTLTIVQMRFWLVSVLEVTKMRSWHGSCKRYDYSLTVNGFLHVFIVHACSYSFFTDLRTMHLHLWSRNPSLLPCSCCCSHMPPAPRGSPGGWSH